MLTPWAVTDSGTGGAERQRQTHGPQRRDYNFRSRRAVLVSLWVAWHGMASEGRCPFCLAVVTYGETVEALHNVPKRDGGAFTLANLIPGCRRCNEAIGTDVALERFALHFHPSVVPLIPEGKANRLHFDLLPTRERIMA